MIQVVQAMYRESTTVLACLCPLKDNDPTMNTYTLSLGGLDILIMTIV